MAHWNSHPLILGTLVLVTNLACSAEGASGGTDEGTGGSSPVPGAGGEGSPGTGGTPGFPTTGGGPSFGGVSGSGSTPGTDADGGCFSTSSSGEVITETREVTVTTYSPVDLFIMYDQSGSMRDDTPVGSKWEATKKALEGFVDNPGSGDMGVGIGFFPLSPPACTGPGPGCACIPIINWPCWSTGGGSCNPADYAIPAVPIQMLPGAATAIKDAVAARRPDGGTPTAPALAGAHQYAAQWAADHPDRKTVVVLATDGEPQGCSNNSVQDVANIAAGALAATPSVMTFVVGVGKSLTSLNAIAAAGGSTEAIIVDAASGDPTQQFIDAMNKIRDSVTTTTTETVTVTAPLPCEWGIPPPPEGETFDKNKVNVEFVSGGGSGQRIGAVSSESDCANVSGGWYYDNPQNPTKVLVCPATCQTIQAITDARIDVIFGCATEPAIIE